MKMLLCIMSLCILNNFAITDDIKRAISDHTINNQKEIVIIVPTYNNSRQDVCIKNIGSILEQSYDNFQVYIVNDCSTDDTCVKLKTFLNNHPLSYKVTLIDNTTRVGAMANYYNVIHALPDHVIVLNIDGDDWLPGPQVLAYINDVYADERIWLTYGQYVEYPRGDVGFCKGYPAEVILKNSFRKHGLPISHLRTYYAWLFKHIKKEDLMYNGDFVQATCDKAMMVPMVEMTGGRFKCIADILYIYNAINPISDMRIYGNMQGLIRDRLFKMEPYQPLADPIVDFATEGVG